MKVKTKKGHIDPELKEQGDAIKKILKEFGFTIGGFYQVNFSDKASPATDAALVKILQGRYQSNTLDVQKDCVKILAREKAKKESIFDPSDEKILSTTIELFDVVFKGRYRAEAPDTEEALEDFQSSTVRDNPEVIDAFQESVARKQGAEHIFELDRYDTTKVWLSRSENGSLDMNAEAHDPEESYAFKKLFVKFKSEDYLALEEVEDDTTEGQFCKIQRRSGKGNTNISMTVMVSALGNELPPHSVFGDLGYQVMRHKDVSAPFSIEMVAHTPSRQVTDPGRVSDEKDEAIDRIKWILDNHPERAALGEYWDLADETQVPVYIGRFHWSPDEK